MSLVDWLVWGRLDGFLSVCVCVGVCLFHAARHWEVIGSLSLDEEVELRAILFVYTLIGSIRSDSECD